MMTLHCILFYFLISYCVGIREDYFIDHEEQSSKEQSEDTTSSMYLKYLHKLQGNATNSSLGNVTLLLKESTRSKKEDDDDDYYDTDDNLINTEIAVGKRIYKGEYTEDDAKGRNKSKSNTSFDIFQDYVYRYDEPLARQVLRHEPYLEDFKTNETLDVVNSTDVIDETTEKLLIDFYNLQPAGSKLIIEEKSHFSNIYQNFPGNNIWYVPENLPCWELPILYGELGESRRRNVFLTFGGRLKNVIEKVQTEKLAPKKLNIPVSQTVNKWCAAEPCYGDHTLCLFPEPTNSKLCMSDYEVRIPTMVARIGLVNTVNSMRNRVATGVADLYKHLPTAADMNEMIYDFDLQAMSQAWLHQCLPGPSACSSLEGNYVSQLECTKYTEHCCANAYRIETGTTW